LSKSFNKLEIQKYLKEVPELTTNAPKQQWKKENNKVIFNCKIK